MNGLWVSFVVPAYNEEGMIHDALEDLQGVVGPRIEVLAGTDGFTDEANVLSLIG